jgi:hypothetical protein
VLCIDRRVAAFLSDLPPADLAPVVRRARIGLSRHVAAALCRRSPHCVRAAIEAGTLPADFRGSHPYVTPHNLAHWAGAASYTASDFADAFARTNARGSETPAGPKGQISDSIHA